ncbi:MADS-box transcription factor 26-like [Canna indica]|uniref:MADS-box transcription factor 26-like n=1 Tax=Canna indica TaxID=4628 RepID=A0AAQ3L1Y1_9LILI|nr:MADS-box transcription factor 26-like [Canna indica]
MARGKVQLKRIENPAHRQATFCKRRTSLLKKAKELSVLCDADIGIFIFSTHGKLYELATKGTMEGLIERYKMTCGDAQTSNITEASHSREFKEEISTLKQEIDLLHKSLRYMLGERTAGLMTLDELLVLEKHLEMRMNHIRAKKMQIMFQEIQSLKNKEGVLKAANKFLREKLILEQNGLFDVPPMTVQQNGNFDAGQMLKADVPYPLTIHDEYNSNLGGCSNMSFSL